MRQKKDQNEIWLILGAAFLIITIIFGAVWLGDSRNRKKAEEKYEKLAEAVNTLPEGTEEAETEEEEETEESVLAELGIEVLEKNLDWAALHEENEDIYAWIYVPDTDVDYPVLRHPTDNSYYLNHNLDGSEGYPGCIYSEDYNATDFSDVHTVLNGHNISKGENAGTMFSSLHNFEDEKLFEEDHYIYIYTEEKVFVYRIFAAYEYRAIHLLDNFDYTNEYVYEDYLKQIYNTHDRVANVRQDVNVTVSDRILTLSTCTTDHDASLRFLVTGVLLNPDE